MMWGPLDLKKMETLNPKPALRTFCVFLVVLSLILVVVHPGFLESRTFRARHRDGGVLSSLA